MQKGSFPESRWKLVGILFVLALVTAMIVLPGKFVSSAAQKGKGSSRTESFDKEFPNFDIREEKTSEISESMVGFRDSVGKSAVDVADIRDNFVRGEEALKQRIPTLKVDYNNDLRIPEVIAPDVAKGYSVMARTSGGSRVDMLKRFVRENEQLIQVSNRQVDELVTLADQKNPNNPLAFTILEQRINGIPVLRGEIKAGFDKDGNMFRVINNLAPGVDSGNVPTDFGDPENAINTAFRSVKRQRTSDERVPNAERAVGDRIFYGNNGDVEVTKIYFPTEPGVVVAAWRVIVYDNMYSTMQVVDAKTGTMLWRKGLGESQTQTATYNVYYSPTNWLKAMNSPAPMGAPSADNPTLGVQAPYGTRTDVALIGTENGATFNTEGWIKDGDNTTAGNNVLAGPDLVSPNGTEGAVVGAPTRVFNVAYTPGTDAPSTTNSVYGGVTNVFYLTNRYHDELYKLGFTEQFFNFQENNYGRGGVSGDRIWAEAQDFSGTDNANFGSPAGSVVGPDGGRGVMQMYVWTGPTPDRDGDLDADVVVHELTHGTSSRLHGNTAGITNNMTRGMGEGWGDFYAHVMLSQPGDPIDNIYSTGGWATYLITAGFAGNYYYGIRRFPKAPISKVGPNGKPHNPLTFRYLNAGCDALIGTTTSNPPPNSAYPRGPVGSTGACDQVHNAGEIWSSTLWEFRTRMVQRLGFATGNQKTLQAVTDGMKGAPLNPTMLQERDAIIASLQAAGDALSVKDAWSGFAARGMGASASVQGTSPSAVTESFDLPNARLVDPFSVSDAPGDNDGFPEPGELVRLSISVSNSTGDPVTGVNVSVNGGPAVSYGTIANGATVSHDINYTVPSGVTCGDFASVSIVVSSDLGAQPAVVKQFRVGAPVGGAPVTFTSAVPVRIPGGTATIGTADVYPTTINVAGLTGNKKIILDLTDVSTTYPGDMDWLLVGPGGQKFIVMSDVVSSFVTQTNATIHLKDDAANSLPTTATAGFNIAGDWKPTDITSGDAFAAPAPAGPYQSPAPVGTATFASVFGTDGAAMNGTWNLYGVDDVSGDFGTISGWKLTFEANDFVCSVAPSVRSRADFDGDGKTDLSVKRNSDGNWYALKSTGGVQITNWGLATDTIVPGDYDHDGKADAAVYRPSTGQWFILNSSNSTVSIVSFGVAGDVPVAGDYDGDGKTDEAIYRPSAGQWYAFQSSTNTTSITTWGNATDVPVQGDYDNDGKTDVAVYRASTGVWYIFRSTAGPQVVGWGIAGDKPVQADYDGDNKDDIAIYRPSTGVWYIFRSTDNGVGIVTWGNSTDVPVPGDYDGDGKDDEAVFRNGTWFVFQSTAGPLTATFGVTGDVPVPSKYIP